MKQSNQPMNSLGLYVAIPFCRAKCSFCNFASDAFAPALLPTYVDRLTAEIASARIHAHALGAHLPNEVDTLYFGGGTPSLLAPAQIRQIFTALRHDFRISPDAEITVECAPGQLSPSTLEELQRHGVNRLSFGVQSFVDQESAAVGRLHTAAQTLAELRRVRSVGILNLSLDLIAGLPHQTESSWRDSINQAIDTGVPHLSVYMLEVDEDSRLGHELLAGGPRYGAPCVPSDDDSASFYELASDLLDRAGIAQYEISNFARPGFRSAHNWKYWTRQPYLGLGLDAHSMLPTPTGAVRFSNTDNLDAYLADGGASHLGSNPHYPRAFAGSREPSPLELLQIPASARSKQQNPLAILETSATAQAQFLTSDEAFEETVFLGLRTTDGLSLEDLRRDFGHERIALLTPALSEAAEARLLTLAEDQDRRIRLTPRGRVLSNEVFSRLLLPTAAS